MKDKRVLGMTDDELANDYLAFHGVPKFAREKILALREAYKSERKLADRLAKAVQESKENDWITEQAEKSIRAYHRARRPISNRRGKK